MDAPGTYKKLDARLVRWTQKSQTPSFQPDELALAIALGTAIKPLAEIIYVVDQEHVFHGFATARDDSGGSWAITCKSVQWLLDWRYIPYFIWHDVNLNAILASDAPSTTMGMLFLVNSLIPQGDFSRWSTYADRIYSSKMYALLNGHALYASSSFPNAGTIDGCDGVQALTLGSWPNALTANQYYLSAVYDDLYVRFGDFSYAANAYLVCASNAFDTRIRLKSCSLGTKVPTIDFSLEGRASTMLEDFIFKLGLETAFRPNRDGYVDMILAASIGRTAADTHKRYVDGENCSIKIADAKNPAANAIIGLNADENPQPQTAFNWDLRTDRVQLWKTYENNSVTLPQIKQLAEAYLEDNENSYEIATPDVDSHLRVGDSVTMWRKDFGEKEIRISRIIITPGLMKLTVGRTLFSPSQTFGEYLRKTRQTQAVDTTTSQPVANAVITSGTGTFTVTSENLATSGFQVLYKESFTVPDEEDDASIGVFCDVMVNGVIVPPGRLKIESGSLEIDITAACIAGSNSITRNLYNADGWESSEAKVEQWQALAFIDP